MHVKYNPGDNRTENDTHVYHGISLALFHALFRSISALRSLMVLVISPSTP